MNDGIRIIHGDCLEVLPTLDRGEIAAIVTDPPYGMDWETDSTRFSGGASGRHRYQEQGRDDWGDIDGDSEPFDPSPWLDFPKVVLWEANHYAARLPVGTTLVWIKKAPHLYGTFLSDAEVGWMKGGYGVYCFEKQFPPPARIKEGGFKNRVAHPTQKPIELMMWAMDRAGIPVGATVLDPYGGSGTTAVASLKSGRRCIVIEKDARYIPIIERRVREASTPLFAGLDAGGAGADGGGRDSR